LGSVFGVTDLSAATVASAGLALAELLGSAHGMQPDVVVDRRLASLWFGMSIRPMGWTLPGAWDAVAGDYATEDGWIRLHTNAPHHRRAAESVLGEHPSKAEMAKAVARWRKADLEAQVLQAGGCAAEMNSLAQWRDHPQGQAVGDEPLVSISMPDKVAQSDWLPDPARPLAGVRVLDLTRVLAGPVSTRFLAGFGAEVLRVDPLDWDEPSLEAEVTLGKRCTGLDLREAGDRAMFEQLLGQADVLIHGYRPGALDGLGYDANARRAIRPGLIDVCLDAYGWTGPWAGRRGFDSLVQMSTGIAAAGQAWAEASSPVPLPVQALDHATGYLIAATAVRGIKARMEDGSGTWARLSLARTAKLLVEQGMQPEQRPLSPESAEDLSPSIEKTAWGDARRIKPCLSVEGAPMGWTRPACALKSAPASWS
jgi:crotonobetainyl-CoA:carnitine CoA-transferase CaiB-like acyl-CoA transferase